MEHPVVGQKLHIDYKPQTTSIEKAYVGESGYNIGAFNNELADFGRDVQILSGQFRP